MKSTLQISVVGSLNVDFIHAVDHLPKPGETITARSLKTDFGGKGANQAIAASRAGANVILIGALGADSHGKRYRAFLESEGILTSSITELDDATPTGSACILVSNEGENCIVVTAGANGSLTPAIIESHAHHIQVSNILLLQLEIPLQTAKRAAEIARQSNTKIIINPSPWTDSFKLSEWEADYIIVNESEARSLTGTDDLSESSLDTWIQRQNLEALIITQGARPTLLVRKKVPLLAMAPPNVQAVDTVGAGDSFAGHFAHAIAEGCPLEEAVRRGNAAGAVATQKAGAQNAIPNRTEILERLDSINVSKLDK